MKIRSQVAERPGHAPALQQRDDDSNNWTFDNSPDTEDDSTSFSARDAAGIDIRQVDLDNITITFQSGSAQPVEFRLDQLDAALPLGGGVTLKANGMVERTLPYQLTINGGPLGDEPLRRAMSRDWVLPGETYYDLLIPFAKGGLDLWETMYYQVLLGEDPVLEWVKGTGLRPALIALNDADRERFVSTYAAALREAYPMRSDGVTLYPFRRLFMVATV